MDKTAIVIILIIVVAGVGFFLLQNKPNNPPVEPTPLPAGIVYFYGSTCSHCKEVEDYITTNQIDKKVSYTSLEVFENRPNALLLLNVGVLCKLDKESLGAVPLAYDGSKCYLGSPDVINFFKNAANLQ